jgi:uncharacterized membrane protein YdjX (TVP38/TMEM64 family)
MAARSMKIRRLASLLALALAVGVGVWVHRQGGLELNPQALREQIQMIGWWAPLVFMAVAALRPVLLLPSFMVMSAGGLLFGWLGGVVFSTLGFSIGAIGVFVLARELGRDAIQGRLQSGRLRAVDAFLHERGAPWLGLWTALPVTLLTPAFAAAGLSGMRLGAFALWVTLGLIPRSALYSFFGDALTQDRDGILRGALVLGGACVVGAFALRRMLRGTLGRRGASHQSSDGAKAGEPEEPRSGSR